MDTMRAALVLASLVLAFAAFARAGVTAIVGRPTDCSAAISVASDDRAEAYVAYGGTRSQTDALMPGAPRDFELRGLAPGSECSYRVMARRPGDGEFRPVAEGSFRTCPRAGATFTFGVQGDSHPERVGKMFDPALYSVALSNAAKDAPDFYFLMGDDFSIDPLIARGGLTAPAVDAIYARQRDFLAPLGKSSALFLVNGNHEQAALCNLDGTTNSPAVLAGSARLRFFPLPAPDAFYTGDPKPVPGVGLPRDYYAWEWGDALFVVIDPYWHSPTLVDSAPGGRHGAAGGKGRDRWSVTLGDAQYRWLDKTLSESKARWKFVFCHHVLGGGRGGIECAPLFEWGGRGGRGGDEFGARRPGWAEPIHRLMAKSGVTIFFQGHDHLYARQELDGVVYQTCPCPADPAGQALNRQQYASGVVLPNSGHLRVTVAPEKVAVDYVRASLRGVPGANGEVVHRYEVPARP